MKFELYVSPVVEMLKTEKNKYTIVFDEVMPTCQEFAYSASNLKVL